MTTQLKEQIINHPFLCTMSQENQELVTKNAKRVEYAPGEIIFRQGEPANRLFLIDSGRVNLESAQGGGQSVRIQTLGEKEVIGWSWLFPPFSWHFTARAVEPTIVTVLDGGHLLVTAEENPSFGYDLMRRVAQIVIERLQTTRKQVKPADEQLSSN